MSRPPGPVTPEKLALIAEVKRLRGEGLSRQKIAVQLGVKESFVAYHVMRPEVRARKLAAKAERKRNRDRPELARVVVQCSSCGAPYDISLDALHKRRLRGDDGHCRFCSWRAGRGLPLTRAERTDEERARVGLLTSQEIHDWAAETVARMTPAERRAVAALPTMLDPDDSRFVRRRAMAA